MKNTQKGFVMPLLLALIAVLLVGGGVYVYENKKVEVPTTVVDTGTKQSNQNQQQTNTQTLPVITQQNPTNKAIDVTPATDARNQVSPQSSQLAPKTQESNLDYYILQNNTLTVNEQKFPKAIGEYQFRNVDTSYGTESQRAFLVSYSKDNPPRGTIAVNMGQTSSAGLAETVKNLKQYTYKNSTLYYYEGADAAYIWETNRPLNGVMLLYTNASGEDKIIHKDGSEAEMAVLNWFLKEFPIK